MFDAFPRSFRIGALRLHPIVDDNDVSAAAREGAPDRSREPAPAEGGLELQLGVFGTADPGLREQPTVQRRTHERPTVVGVLARKLFGIADADDPSSRI